MRSRPPCLGCEPEMRVWLSKTEARELRDWAIRQGDSSLADRLHRLAQSNGSEPPPDWRRREDHPLLVRCSYCEQWESYAEHRWAKQDFVHFEGAWVHHACLDGWKENRVEIERRRNEARTRKDLLNFLFQDEELLAPREGILIRTSLTAENPWLSLIDADTAEIQNEFGDQRVLDVVHQMSEDVRHKLIAAGFHHFHHHYHIVLGWIFSVPPEYDGKEIGDDVMCRSVLVTELPKKLRQMLPQNVRAAL